MTYKKEDIIKLLEESDVAVERAILRIYAFQTSVEQSIQTTIDHNNVGFNACHAEFLSSLAEWIKRSRRPEGQRLSAKQMKHGRKMIKHYWKQLMRVANGEM